MESDDVHKQLMAAIKADYLHAEMSLSYYFKCAWRVLEPRTPLKWNWDIEYTCEHLEAVELGQIKRLLITRPPRGAKSNLVTVAYPTWVWLRRPDRRFMAASYSGSLSTKHSVDRRNIIDSVWYQRGYGTRYKLASDQNVKTEFMNDKRGHMIATSMTGTATGKGCNRLIIDDPINPKEAESEVERESANAAFDTTFTSRLDDKKEDAIIIVMQRLHEDDLVGHVKEKDDWVHVELAAEAQDDQRLVFPLSGRVVERKRGDLLNPDREGTKELAALRRSMGTRQFQAQYNQRPTGADGNIVKLIWLKHYDEAPADLAATMDELGIFADLAYKDGEENDYTVVELWGRKGPDIYLLSQLRDHLDFPGQVAALRKMVAAHPDAVVKEIEEKANGAALIQVVKDTIPGIVANNPKTSKGARLAAVSPLYEAGNVHYPNRERHPWVENNIHELLSMGFDGSKSKHDDTVDVASMAVSRFGKVAISVERLEALSRW